LQKDDDDIDEYVRKSNVCAGWQVQLIEVRAALG